MKLQRSPGRHQFDCDFELSCFMARENLLWNYKTDFAIPAKTAKAGWSEGNHLKCGLRDSDTASRFKFRVRIISYGHVRIDPD